MIGRIGTILGEAGVNIARMSLGRNRAGALAMVQVDGEVPAELLGEAAKSAVDSKLNIAGSVTFEKPWGSRFQNCSFNRNWN